MVMTPIVFWASFEPCEKAIHAADSSCARPKMRVTAAGNAEAKKLSSNTITMNAAEKPRIGENTRPWNVFSRPPNWIELHPAPATPAPTRLKISAWLELDGMPKYQVKRFHRMAETSAEMTSACVDSSGGMMPLPTVVATALPGDSTLVATTVAMALAVSWKPLMKSKIRPRIRIRSRTSRSTLSVSSGILEGDVAQNGRHSLRLVGCVLEQLVQVVPAHGFDELRDLGDSVVQRGNRLREQIVGFVLQPVDLLRCGSECLGL